VRKSSSLFALLLVLAIGLSGCGGGAASEQSSSAPAGSRGTAASRDMAANAPGEASVTSVVEAGGDAVGADAPVTDRKIIQNAEIELHVRDVDEALNAVHEAVRRAGGYVQGTDVSGTRESGRHVSMTLRVPAGSFTSILDVLSGLGERERLRQWTDDVTEEYLDLEARIATKEAHLAQLNKLYERSGTISEMLELEREIARVTAELESLKGRYNYLSNQVAFSTIGVNMYEPGVPMPRATPQTLGERMRDSFLYSWNATIAMAESLLIALVSIIPVLLFLVVIAAVVFILIKLIGGVRRRGGPGGAGDGRADRGASGGQSQSEGGQD